MRCDFRAEGQAGAVGILRGRNDTPIKITRAAAARI
jgi:hypothetical protein